MGSMTTEATPDEVSGQTTHQIRSGTVLPAQREDVEPVGGEAVGLEVIAPAIGEVVEVEVDPAGAVGVEVLEVAGEAGVARIAAAEDHAGAGEERRDQAEVQDVARHLVDDAACSSVAEGAKTREV